MKSNFRRRLGALATLGVLTVGLGGLGTLAAYTDQDMVTDNTFSAGHLDLSITPGTAVLTAENMAPGDEVSNSVTVTNDGTFPLTYTVALSQAPDSGTLGEVLDVSVHAAADAEEASEDNRLLFQEGLPDLDTVTISEVERFLEPGESEPLFLHAGMQITAGTEHADQHAELHFTFDALQAPDSIFAILAEDDDSDVLLALATNPVTPAKYVNALLPFEDESANQQALWATDMSAAALQALAPYSPWGPPDVVYTGADEEMLRWAAEQGDSWRSTVLRNLNAPSDLRTQILNEYIALMRDGTATPAVRAAVLSAATNGTLATDEVVDLLEEGLFDASQRSRLIRAIKDIPSSYVDGEIWKLLTTEGDYWDVSTELTSLGAHPSATINLDLVQSLYDYDMPEVEEAIGYSAYLGQDLAMGYALNPSLTPADVDALLEMSHGGWDDRDPALMLMFNPATPEALVYDIVATGDFSDVAWPHNLVGMVRGWGANDNVSTRVVDATLALGDGEVFQEVLASPNSVHHHDNYGIHSLQTLVIVNRGTPSNGLITEYLEADMWNYSVVLGNENLTAENVDHVARILASNGEYLARLARDHQVSGELVSELVQTSDGRIGLAAGTQLPPALLRQMAESDDVRERVAVAQSPLLRSH